MSFLQRLVERSSLTPRQLDALASYVRVASGEIKLKEAASIASEGRKKGELARPLTIGSYYRTVTQARTNIEESLVTALVAIWIGLIREDDIRRLFELVAGGARELSEEESDRFMQLLDALLKRMIT
jgi:hypothetical protein